MPNEKKEYNYVRKTFHFDGLKYEVTGKTEEEAIKKKLEKLRQLKEGRVDSSITVKRWARIWLDTYVESRDITKKSKKMYPDYLERYILPAIGNLRLDRVTAVGLQQLLNSQKGRSNSHVTKLRIVLKAVFRDAYRARLLAYDPAVGLIMPKTTTGSHRSLTDAERKALIAVASMPSFGGKKNLSGCWLMIMLRCGLRPGETCALLKASVDMKTATLHVTEAKESGSVNIKDPKTAAGTRDIPIPIDLIPWLERQLVLSDSPYLFTQKDGVTPLTEDSMKRRWATVKKYMDIEMGAKVERIKPKGKRRSSLVIVQSVIAEDLDLYDLRHTYCTDLQKALVPLNIAKSLMGHKDIATTANIYTHADEYTVEAARALIDSRPVIV